MVKINGKSEVQGAQLDVDHELPAGEAGEVESSRAAQNAMPQSPSDVDSETLKLERDSLLDRLARMQADFENARKRAAREQQEYRDYAVTDSIKALLPTLDSFERALQAENLNPAEFRSGVELIHKQLLDALTKLGLRSIPAKGEPFDPRFHEAIEMIETEEAPDHEVLEELQRGYKLKDRLIRPAMVRVARNDRS
jgi:molecular chaperone GrpE